MSHFKTCIGPEFIKYVKALIDFKAFYFFGSILVDMWNGFKSQ